MGYKPECLIRASSSQFPLIFRKAFASMMDNSPYTFLKPPSSVFSNLTILVWSLKIAILAAPTAPGMQAECFGTT